MQSLRIVFMGTPDFAVASLKALLDAGCHIVGVVTSPDKPAGRGLQLNQSAVKKFALEQHLEILQPEKLKDEKFIERLANLKADLQLVVAFRMLPEVVWNMPRLGTYNLHASLLPRYRGAAPINWAIINGETETGVTTFKLKHEIDSGNVLFAEKVNIGNTTTAGELHDELMKTGAALLVRTVNEIETCLNNNREPAFKEQEINQVSHAPKLQRTTCRINWNEPVQTIYNLIRGLSPYPAAYTEMKSDKAKALTIKLFITEYELKHHNEPNGLLSTDNKTYLKVFCKGGIVTIKELQAEGKRRMPVEDFLRGFAVPVNATME